MSKFLTGLVTGLAGLAAFSAPHSPIRYPHKSDAEALASDWRAVGDDMRASMRRVSEEAEKEPVSSAGDRA